MYCGKWNESHLVFQKSSWSKDMVKDVLADMGINCWQRVVQQVNVWLPVHGSCQTQPLLLTPGQVKTLNTLKFLTPAQNHMQNFDQWIYKWTFSPISVASAAGRRSRSGSKAQASRTRWYQPSFFWPPNTIFSFKEAFWTQACCGA